MDSDTYSGISQDPDIDICDCIDRDAEICRSDMSDSYSNSDYGQSSVNVGGDDDPANGVGYNGDNDN